MKKRIITGILALMLVLTVCQGISLASWADGDWVQTGQPLNIGYQSNMMNYLTLNGSVRGFRYTYFWFLTKDGIREEHPVYCMAPDMRGAFELVRDDGTTGDESNTARYITGDRITRADYITIMEAGYPHNTYPSLGVNSVEEAYYATKIALWMVILGITPGSGGVAVNTSHPDQAAALRVYNAAIATYNVAQSYMWAGYSEPEVRIPAPTAANSWHLSSDGQWYEMTTQVRTNKYIGTNGSQAGDVQFSWDTSTGTLPTGTVVLNGNDDITATMKPLPANRVTAGIWRVQPITIRVPAQFVDQYFVDHEDESVFPMPTLKATAVDMAAMNFYVATYSGNGGQPYLIEGDRKADVSTAFQTVIPRTYTEIDIPYDMGLRIIKLQTGTLIPLPGAVIEVYDPHGQCLGSYATDENGEINIQLGAAGTYTIKETIPPQYHILPTHTSQQVQVSVGEVAMVTVTNDPYGALRVEKRDSANGRPLGGASIQIRHITSGTIYSAITDYSGVAEFTDLPIGGYEIRELTAPSGYALDTAAHTVAVHPQTQGVATYTLLNRANPGLRIKKLDRASSAPIEGVVFEVWHDGALFGEYTTNFMGEILLTNLPAGTYTAREKSTVAPYVLDATAQWIEITAGQGHISELIFLNSLKPGIHLVKLDSATMQPLVNAAFVISKVGGSFIQEFTTDINGEVNLTALEPGAYTVEEVKAPTGYLIDDSIRTVQINPGENAVFVFTDTKMPSLELVKYDPINNEYLGGATFRIARIEDGSRYLDRITDIDGRIRIDGLEPGVYSVQEISAPSGYVLNETEHHVQLFPGRTSQIVVENIRKPSLIVWKYDEQTARPLPDTEFSIAHKGGSVIYEGLTNGEGFIRLDGLDPGWYTVTEMAPPPGYLNSIPSSRDVYLEPGRTIEVKFDNLRCPTLTILKLDSITRDPIRNVRFNVRFSPAANFTGGVVDLGNYTTDESGRIILDDSLQSGWYRVTELEPAAGYIMKEPTVQEIFLRGGEDKTLEFENIPRSALIIHKTDLNGLPLQGATFEIRYLGGTSGSGGTVIKTGVTSPNGTITITGLAPGTYVVEEMRPATGHQLSSPSVQTAVITDSDQCVVELHFSNPRMGRLVIEKRSSAANHLPIAGVTFRVTDSSGAVIGPNNGLYTTDPTGIIIIDEWLPIGSTVIVTEISGPDDYNLDAPPQTVRIQEGATHTLTFYNSPRSGAQIIKVDADTKQPLKDARFRVVRANGEVIGDYTTDADGLIVIPNLEPGWYKAFETRAPDGYILDDTPKDFEVTGNQFIRLEFENRSLGGLQILKIDEDTRRPIPNVEFSITRMNGERLSANTFITDAWGNIYLHGLEDGWYTVTETKAAAGYLLDPSPRNVEVRSGAATPLRITNQRAASLMIEKTDSITGAGIYGVTFILYDSGRNPIMQIVTDQGGFAYVRNELTAGRYYLRELEPAEGYERDDQWKTIYIEAGRTTHVEWKNTPIRAQIQIVKYSSDYNSITGAPAGSLLSGAVFEITRARSGAVVGYITTDARGVAASEPLPLGRYYVTEVTAPQYYQLSGDRMEADLEYPGQIARLSAYNRSAALGIDIRKVGNVEVVAGDSMRYDFTIANTSNVPLSEFYWQDRLPTDASRVQSITTGTYNQRLYYRVLYKTNYSDWRILASNLLSTNNYSYSLSAAALGLMGGEMVTHVRYEFGTVAAGFASATRPTITVQTLPTLANGYQIINRAEAGGRYGGAPQVSTTAWVTKVVRFSTPPDLPRTGY
ncbi:MAG: SpaA isopeptide-forming pilin-related protein [Oscillospiraceae bacterium]|nr:SpaA isopeptide-forming pilin-related protein [Oscillospiraceae bacterium]